MSGDDAFLPRQQHSSVLYQSVVAAATTQLCSTLSMQEPSISKQSDNNNDSNSNLKDSENISQPSEAFADPNNSKNSESSTFSTSTASAVQNAVDHSDPAQATLDESDETKTSETPTKEESASAGVAKDPTEANGGDGDVKMSEASGTEGASLKAVEKDESVEAMDVDTTMSDEKKEETTSSNVGVVSQASETSKEVAEDLLLFAKGTDGGISGTSGKAEETTTKSNGDDSKMEVDEPMKEESAGVDDATKEEEGEAKATETAADATGEAEKHESESATKDAMETEATTDAGENKESEPESTTKSEGDVGEPKADKPESAVSGSTEASSSSTTPAASAPPAAAAPPTSASPAAASPGAPAPPLLRGTLSYNLDQRRHIIRGMWNYEKSTAFPPQRFDLVRNLEKGEDPTELPKDGEFHGSFSLAYYHTTSKGKQKERSKVISESGVKIKFTKIDGKDDEYNVDGQGTNQFGVFNINGTAKPSPHAGSEKSYDIELRKRYVPSQVPVAPPPVATAGDDSQKPKKAKKRKHDEVGDDGSLKDDKIADEPEGELPPPSQSYPNNVICLRGKLSREESDNLGMSEVVHRISGMWAPSLELLLADPQNVRGMCNKFEYEHKSTLPNDRFPVSGRYSGYFELTNPDNVKSQIKDQDVTLKFRKNNEGYYNVEGRGSNAFGKYSITGTMTNDNVITIFRHFQLPKKQKKIKNSAGQNVTSAPGPLQGSQTAKARAPPPEPKLKMDDVILPSDADDSAKLDSISPPAHGTYSAISRGVLRQSEDNAITCSGKWAITREHFNNGTTSAFSFRLEPHFVAEAVSEMEKKEEEGVKKEDAEEKENKDGDEAPPSVVRAPATFPVDSAMYKGSFQMKRGASKTTKIIDQQIVLKFRKNSAGTYNVYGKGINNIGEFDLKGTLILSGKSSGHVELYRIYPAPPQPPAPPAGAVAAKAPGTKAGPKLPTKENAKDKASAAAAAVPKPRPGLVRRESSRLIKLPSRLEDDDPQAQLSRIMEKCGQVLKFMLEKDIAHGAFFREPVDPMALGIPTYHQIIKEPMDLGTIQKKLDKGEITTPEEFGRLVRLVFENAVKFNVDPGHAVHQAARNLLILFNQKFRDLERTVDQIRRTYKPSKEEQRQKEKEEAKKLKRKAKEEKRSRSAKRMRLDEAQAMAEANANAMAAVVSAAPTNSAPGGSITRAEFNMLLQMIQKLQNQVVQTHKLLANLSSSKEPDDAASASASMMSEGDSVFVPPKEISRPSSGKGKAKKKDAAAAAKAEKVALEESRPLSLKEQEALTETINLLPDDRLPGVIQIIRESTHLNGDEEEIDLEIDQLDTVTQRKLQRYVLQVRLARLLLSTAAPVSSDKFTDPLPLARSLLLQQ